MATNLSENYSDLCRICASKTSVLVGINIFEGEGTIREIIKKITTCLPIQIHEEDQLPKMICEECDYNLDLFFNFREKSLQTESVLIGLIKKLNIPTIKNNIVDSKMINNQPTMNIVPTVSDQQLSLHNQVILAQTTHLVHELTKRENMNVEEDILLNSQNLNMNHALDSIEISSHELPTNMANIIHEQELNLQRNEATEIGELVEEEINIQHSQLTVQNLELIHAQFEQEHIKIKNNEEDKIPALTLKTENDLIGVKIEENIKNEPENNSLLAKAISSDSSDTDDSSILDFDPSLESAAGEVIKNDDSNENQFYFENQLYEQTRDQFFNSNEIGTSVSSDGSQWYYCNICGKAMSDKDDFLTHYEEHVNKCLICQTAFPNIETLNLHRRQMHPKKQPIGEPKSPKVPKTRTRLKPALKSDSTNETIKKEDSDNDGDNGTHDEDEPDEEDIDKSTKRKRCEPKVCKDCGKIYKTNYKLQEHMRKHTGEQPYKCGTCDKAFRSKIGLAQHEAKHTGQYDFSCPTCGKGFQCRSYLIVHQRVHSDLKPYPCTTCGSNFKTKQSLLDHMNRHLGVKPYLCDICGRGFITKGLWKSHQKIHSGMDNRQYPCTVCNKMFVSKSYLATHLRIHTGEKPFMCEVCGKGFLTRVDLRIHSTMHTGEKSFVCEMCGKAFARRDALRCHRRSHTGERPYRCDVCGQTFTQFSPMAIHKRLHTGERPYSCEVCSKTFVSRSTMMCHRKKHVP